MILLLRFKIYLQAGFTWIYRIIPWNYKDEKKHFAYLCIASALHFGSHQLSPLIVVSARSVASQHRSCVEVHHGLPDPPVLRRPKAGRSSPSVDVTRDSTLKWTIWGFNNKTTSERLAMISTIQTIRNGVYFSASFFWDCWNRVPRWGIELPTHRYRMMLTRYPVISLKEKVDWMCLWNRKTNVPMPCSFCVRNFAFSLEDVWEIMNEHVDAVMYPKESWDSYKRKDRKQMKTVCCRLFSSPYHPSSKIMRGSSWVIIPSVGGKTTVVLPSSEKLKMENRNIFSSVSLAGIVISFLGKYNC